MKAGKGARLAQEAQGGKRLPLRERAEKRRKGGKGTRGEEETVKRRCACYIPPPYEWTQSSESACPEPGRSLRVEVSWYGGARKPNMVSFGTNFRTLLKTRNRWTLEDTAKKWLIRLPNIRQKSLALRLRRAIVGLAYL